MTFKIKNIFYCSFFYFIDFREQTNIAKLHCTVVNKGMKIGILDFELGAFSETLEHL